MDRLSAVEARTKLRQAVESVDHAGRRVILTVNGKDRAALVSLSDLALLERLEDEEDIRIADERLAAIERGDEKPLTLAQLDRALGLAPERGTTPSTAPKRRAKRQASA